MNSRRVESSHDYCVEYGVAVYSYPLNFITYGVKELADTAELRQAQQNISIRQQETARLNQEGVRLIAAGIGKSSPHRCVPRCFGGSSSRQGCTGLG